MKILLLIALSVGLGIMPAAAQPLLPVFHLNAAAAFPLSPHSFSNGHGVGYGMALGAGVSVLERADVYVEGSLAAFPIDLGQVRDDVRATGGNVSFTGAAIGLRVHFPTPNGTFYVSPRGSMERYKVTDLQIQSSDTTISQAGRSEWAPAASIGAGITFDLIPQAGLFVEADYSLVFAEQQTLQYTPIRVGFTIRPGRAE